MDHQPQHSVEVVDDGERLINNLHKPQKDECRETKRFLLMN